MAIVVMMMMLVLLYALLALHLHALSSLNKLFDECQDSILTMETSLLSLA